MDDCHGHAGGDSPVANTYIYIFLSPSRREDLPSRPVLPDVHVPRSDPRFFATLPGAYYE